MKRKEQRNLTLIGGDLNLICTVERLKKGFEMVIQADSLSKYVLPFVPKALERVLN